ncbi:hypothetical protein DPMN_141934 [Dreissena polymorpha]|uniref:Uncharacterized protein n=1 Tax=Dreissena polymorpha TaxID=45954 RepID=A0A9D4GAC8_DREPO|nr:hypothetical protein DPMN_141934 [Dreissena polymorpha]
MQAAGALVLKESLRTSPGPSRCANAGRPARTGIIRRYFSTKFHYFPVPPRLVPVNPDWLRFIPVKPRQSPGCRRLCPVESRQRPGIAPVVAGTGRTPAEPRYTHQTKAELRQRPGFTPVVADNAPAETR